MLKIRSSLAIHCGVPVRKPRNFIWPIFDADELISVKDCITSRNWWNDLRNPSNCYISKLNKLFKEFHNTNFAIACSSGTTALITSLAALGVGPGKIVICPTYSWISTASSIACLGADIRFCDIDEFYNLDISKIHDVKDVVGILPVHMFGLPCNMNEICSFAKEHGLFVVEDCCLAHGALYNDRFVGSLGDAGCFSFNVFKLVAAGEGGMITISDQILANKINQLINNGQAPEDKWWHSSCIGYNFRLSQLAASITIPQMNRLKEQNEIRRTNADKFREILSDCPGIRVQMKLEDRKSSYYCLPIQFSNLYKVSPARMCQILSTEGFEFREGYGGILPDNKAFSKWKMDNYSTSSSLLKNTICIPHNVLLLEENFDSYRDVFHKLFKNRGFL